MSKRIQLWPLALVFFLGLGVWSSWVVPPFEAPDEISHYALVRHLARGGALPVDDIGPWGQEAYQPPLYYALLGALTAGINQDDFDAISTVNPYSNLGDPLNPGNKNRMLYSARLSPLRGANLALHVDRWISLLMAGIALLLTYGSARLAFPGSRALPFLAVLIVATIPQFVFISASVTNDNLVVMLSSAVIYWLLRLISRPATRSVVWWEWIVLGLLWGLAILSKAQALGLAVPIAAAVLWLAYTRRDWRVVLQGLLLVLLPAMLISGWWFWRNHMLHGKWLYFGSLAGAPVESYHRSLAAWQGELRGLRYSFWGLFGWFNILMPDWVYRGLDVLCLCLGFGIVLRFLMRRQLPSPLAHRPLWPAFGLLLVWVLVLLVGMLYWMVVASGGQGRLFFPGISSLALLLVLGLVSYGDLLPPRWRVFVLVPVPAALAMLTIYALAVLLPSSYAVPPEVAAPPAAAKPVNLRYDPAIELLAAEVPPARFRAGDRVPVTLYLRARTRMTEDYPVFLQILDDKYQVMGNVTTHAGWGRNPTSLWQPGVIYADRYLVPVVNNVSALSPLLAHVYVGFMDPQARGPLPAIGEDGKEQSGMVADVVIERLGQTEQAPLRPADVVYGNVIRLIGYGLDKEVLHPKDVLQVALQWQADGVPAEELTAFVHLLDEDGRVVVGFDGPPAEGRFPTRYWRPGDTIRSEFALALPGDLPPGRYRVGAGLYTTASQGAQRVPITASSQQFKNNIALLSEVEVR